MGFIVDYNRIAEKIVRDIASRNNLRIAAPRANETAERAFLIKARDIVAITLANIVGSGSRMYSRIGATFKKNRFNEFEHTWSYNRNYFSYNYESAVGTIHVPTSMLRRKSLYPQGYEGVDNIVSLIATGYPTDGHEMNPVWGKWRGSRIKSLTKRLPYHRYNKNGNVIGFTSTLDKMLDDIEKAANEHKISCTITIGPSFQRALRSAAVRRVSLYI